MAKSLRSKVKRSFRSKKRETGVYAATEAARLHRLSSKLEAVATRDKDGDVPVYDAEGAGDEILGDQPVAETPCPADEMDPDGASLKPSQRISTHGLRGSRNEQWRISKGMTPRSKSRGMNRQGGISARRKAGRSSRRR